MDQNDAIEKAIELYRDLCDRYHGNYAAMYAFASRICGDIAESGGSEDKLLLYQRVCEFISYSIISEYMKSRDYFYSSDNHEWIKYEAGVEM